MLCQVTLIGNLGREPEIRQSPNGNHFGSMNVATTRRAKRGEVYVNVTEWHTVKVFGREAEWLGKDARKGSKVLVVGHIETETWTGRDGQEKSRQVIVASQTARLIDRAATEHATPVAGYTGEPDANIPF